MEKLIDKIRKLLAKANDESVTEAEAASYAAKAQEMLAAHGLAMSDIPEEEREDHVERDLWIMRGLDQNWIKQVAQSASRLYMCSMINTMATNDRGKRVRAFYLVGRPHNIEVAKEMIKYLVDTTARLGREYKRSIGGTGRENYEFERGCGLRLANRLDELRREQIKPTPKNDASGLPVLYQSEDELVRSWILSNMNTRKMSMGVNAGGSHAAAGDSAGRNISLNPQIARNSGGGRLLS